MWLEIIYEPITLFSLKSSLSTSSGAKTLFAPSPFSIKMALFNAIITYESLETALDNFKLIKNLEVRFKLTKQFIVNNFLTRTLKDNDKVKPEVKKIQPFKSTVAFREYIYFPDIIKIAVKIDNLSEDQINFLKKWFSRINYFGKKDCFFQFISFNEVRELPKGYSSLFNGKGLIPGILQKMDDMDNADSFNDVNNYDFTKKGKRREKIYVFPYYLEYASKKFYFYQKIDS